MLPALDTVSFDDCLPLACHAQDGPVPPALRRETELTLRLLAAPPEGADKAEPTLQRLEAKLDLALELGLWQRHPDAPAPCLCRIGLEAVAWVTTSPPSAPCLLELAPSPNAALRLFLPLQDVSTQPLADGSTVVQARLAPLLDPLHLHWEKWVFRRHRDAIQKR